MPKRRFLVDGMNVIGSRPDGWWRDRRGAMARLVVELERYAENAGADVTVVFDGRGFELPPHAIGVAFAPGGRNAADHEIVRRVGSDPDPASLTVVSSDAELAARVREAGAQVLGSGGFRRDLERS